MRFRIFLLAVAVTLALPSAHCQECDTTFLDALSSLNTFIFEQGVRLAGFADQLPNPSIGVTILVPTNGAWLRFLVNNGFFLGSIGSLGDDLTAVVSYHIFPSALPPSTFDTPGDAQTLLSLLAGAPFPLNYWRLGPEENDRIQFQGTFDQTVAGVSEVIQVCESWIYVVDRVLLPAYTLSEVPKVEIPDLGGILNPPPAPSPPAPTPEQPSPSPTPQGSPAPGEPSPPPPEQPPCEVTWAEAAGSQPGLSLLSTVLGQEAISSQLPGPGEGNTLFAPTDDAFFAMLTTLGISITDALALGDKLVSVILYHASPGVTPPPALASATSLPTLLGQGFDIGVGQNEQGASTVSGLFPDNTATVTGDLTVCNSQVYIIDSVLIPATSVDTLPDPPSGQTPPLPTPSPVTPPPSLDFEGVASGVGYLSGCTVDLKTPSSPPISSTATNTNGQFTLGCGAAPADSAEGGASGRGECPSGGDPLMLQVPGGQGEGCGDAATGLALDTFLQTKAAEEGGVAPLSPLTTLQSVLWEATGRGQWGELGDLLAQQLGIPRQAVDFSGDVVLAAQRGDPDALAHQGASAQLQVLVSVGTAMLAGAQGTQGDVPRDDLARLVYWSLGEGMAQAAVQGDQLDLTNATAVAGVLQGAADDLGIDTDPDAIAGVAEPVSILAGFVVASAEEAGAQLGEAAGRALAAVARIVFVAQSDVAPAASQVGAGQLGVDEFSGSYDEAALVQLIQSVALPGEATAPASNTN